jgi:hypothetical protein
VEPEILHPQDWMIGWLLWGVGRFEEKGRI